MKTYFLFLALLPAALSALDVWTVTGMEKIRLSETMPENPAQRLDFAGMRGELEHGQVCLRSQEALDAPVTVDFSGDLPSGAFSWRQVGYVDCKPHKRYAADSGWWPDPLLEVSDFSLKANKTQPIWITVWIPRNGQPGVYTGGVHFRSGGKELATVPVRLEIWDIELPVRGTFQTAYTFFEYPYPETRWMLDYGKKFYGGEVSPELKAKYYDLLASRRLYADNIYIPTPRPIEDYVRLAEQGANCFNLMEISNANGKGRKQEFTDEYVEMMLAKLEPTVRELRRRDLLKYAYVYGFDECSKDVLPGIRKLYGAVKRRFPDLRTMLLVNWEPPEDLFGVDIWTYLYTKQSTESVRRQQAVGRECWWYHCIGPREPHMNTFIEWPAIQGRLLFWHAAQEKIPGWLYYSVNKWHNQKKVIARIAGGPETDALAAAWRDSNGDGRFLYPGANGPVAAIGLETQCDGIEDYELFALYRQVAEPVLKAAGLEDVDPLQNLIRRVVRKSIDREENPALLSMVRHQAARELLSLQRGEIPGIWLVSPLEKSWIFGKEQTQLIALVNPGLGKLAVNGVPVKTENSLLRFPLSLAAGENVVSITADDAKGHPVRRELRVFHRERYLPEPLNGRKLLDGGLLDGLESTKGWSLHNAKDEVLERLPETKIVHEGKVALRLRFHDEKLPKYRACFGRYIPLMGENLGVSFWLHNEKPGGSIKVELCEKVAWSNWVYELELDWTGWRRVEINWEQFHGSGNHLYAGNGMPDWEEIFWIAFNFYKGSAPAGDVILDDLRWLK